MMSRFGLVLLLSCACLVAAAETRPSDARQNPLQSVSHSEFSIRRKTITGVTLSDNFLGAKEDGSFDYLNYGIWVAGQCGAMFVLGILTLILTPLFLCFRCCCFGKYAAGYGLCCNNRSKGPKTYSKKEVFILKIVITAAVLGTGACVAVCFVNNAAFSKNLVGLFSVIIDTAAGLLADITAIQQALLSLEYTKSMGEQMSGAVQTGNNLINQGNTYKSLVSFYDYYRQLAINLILAVPAAFLAIGVLLGWLNISRFGVHYILVMFLALLLFLSWLSAGIHMLISVAFGDLCGYIAVVEQQNANNPIVGLISCTNATKESFNSFTKVANDGIDSSVAAACDPLSTLCSATYLDPSNTCPGPCNATSILAGDYNGVKIKDNPAATRTIQDCATQCTDSTLKDSCGKYVNGTNLAKQYKDVINNKIAPLLSCTRLADMKTNVQSTLCQGLVPATYGIAVAQTAASVLLTIGMACLVLGAKRFRKANQSNLNKVAPVVYMSPEKKLPPNSNPNNPNKKASKSGSGSYSYSSSSGSTPASPASPASKPAKGSVTGFRGAPRGIKRKS